MILCHSNYFLKMLNFKSHLALIAGSALVLVCVSTWLSSCKSDATTAPTQSSATNTVFFDSLYTNVDVQSGFVNQRPWTIGTILGVGSSLPVNFRFADRPTASGTYTLVTQDKGQLDPTECMFFVNYLAGANSTTYFPKASNTKTATVTISGGKVHVVVEGIEMEGNRGGNAVQPVSANLLEK
jgi:hypothetical protein